jgi:GNAT superfamily N-acetyltransferase
MMTAAVEDWDSVQAEWRALIPQHYDEISLHKEHGVPLDPDYEAYSAINRAGRLLFVGLRDAGSLVGYFIGFVQPHLHYRTCLTCTMDIMYVHPSKRNGTGGLRLLKAAKAELKRRGVACWFMGSKDHKPIGRLYEAMGFKKMESYYSLWI